MNEIKYEIRRSQRRTTAIEIRPDGSVLVRCPLRMSDARVQELVQSKASWIRKKLALQPIPENTMTAQQLCTLAQSARQRIPERVRFYAAKMGVTYDRITIRKQKTRWGSCSSKGNLNFNCLLMLAPEQVVDYVVVHELCHRIHMDHSAAFWAEVEKYMPEHATCRKWLKANGRVLLAKLP